MSAVRNSLLTEHDLSNEKNLFNFEYGKNRYCKISCRFCSKSSNRRKFIETHSAYHKKTAIKLRSIRNHDIICKKACLPIKHVHCICDRPYILKAFHSHFTGHNFRASNKLRNHDDRQSKGDDKENDIENEVGFSLQQFHAMNVFAPGSNTSYSKEELMKGREKFGIGVANVEHARKLTQTVLTENAQNMSPPKYEFPLSFKFPFQFTPGVVVQAEREHRVEENAKDRKWSIEVERKSGMGPSV